MDIPALQRQITDLETSLDSLEHWLAVATALVVMGLVLEYFHDVRELVAELRRKWSWKPLFVLTGALFITVGVTGELGIQFFASRKETILRKANDDLFTIVNGQASGAWERATNNEREAAQLREQAAGLQKQAEDERLARVKLEVEIQPRELSLRQQLDLAARCKAFPGHGVELFSYVGDVEGAHLGGTMKAGLKGLIVSDRRNSVTMVNAPEPEGVEITDNDHALAKLISDALTSAHIANKITPPMPKQGWSTITIGAKPYDALK